MVSGRRAALDELGGETLTQAAVRAGDECGDLLVGHGGLLRLAYTYLPNKPCLVPIIPEHKVRRGGVRHKRLVSDL
jgi:hypothetical protein